MTSMPDRPLLLSGFPHILHGGDYNPDQWQSEPGILDEDLRLMSLAGTNTFSVGIFAWTSYEPEEGRFDFGWLDDIMDRMAAAGHQVILATPSGAKPAWMSKRYAEVRRVNRRGRREPHGGRHNHCFSSSIYRAKVRAIDSRLAQRYANHPALAMWHISNEFSGECFCRLCLKRWYAWLEKKYENLDALNSAWWTSFWSHTFTAFDEIDPRDDSIDGMQLDYRRFLTDQVIDFVGWEIAAIRQYSRDIPCTTNLMGTFGGLDYSRLVEVLDLVADDQYPSYAPDKPELERAAYGVSFKNDLHRCFKPDKPWMLMESCPDASQWIHPMRLKRPGLHQAEMLQALGHGAEGTCYFQWRKGRGGCEKLHGAVVDHVGHEHTRVFQSVAALGQLYPKLEPTLGSRLEAKVALFYDWEVRWAFETTAGLRNRDDRYFQVALDHYQALSRHGITVDVVRSDADLAGYDLVIAPQLWMLRPGVAQGLSDFVRTGGSLVGTYYTGGVNHTNLCFAGGFPGDGLREVFGVWNEETDWLSDGATRRVVSEPNELGLNPSYSAQHVCAVLHLEGAKSLARFDEDYFAGQPALTRNAHGQGEAYYLATDLGPEFLLGFYSTLAQSKRLPRSMPELLPNGVLVQQRVKPGREFLFFQNFTAQEHALKLPSGEFDDLPSDLRLGGTLRVPAWGSTVLTRRTHI